MQPGGQTASLSPLLQAGTPAQPEPQAPSTTTALLFQHRRPNAKRVDGLTQSSVPQSMVSLSAKLRDYPEYKELLQSLSSSSEKEEEEE